MSKRSIYVVTAALIIVLAATTGFSLYKNRQIDYTTQLKTLVDSNWANYTAAHPDFSGGLALKVVTPKEDYFVSTGLGSNVTDAIHFRAASITKTFTAASIMLLYQQDKLDINAKIVDNIPGTNTPYVPDTANYDIPYKNEITIHQLLGHRAGVFDVDNTPIPENCTQPYAGQIYVPWVNSNDSLHQFTFDELVGVAAANKLFDFKPGEYYYYSDTGYSILGKIIERVSNQTYDDYVYKHFIIPNGLTQTTLVSEATETKLPEPFEVGHSYINAKTYETTEDNMSPHVAEGNVISTPSDLARWARLLYTGNAGVNSTLINMMMDAQSFEGQGISYGLGTRYTEGLGYGHDGENIGYMTVMRYDPKTGFTIVISVSNANFDDSEGQLFFLFDLAREVKQLTGYT